MCCSNVSVVESTDEAAFIGAVQDSVHINPWVVILSVNGKSLKFEIDISADVLFHRKCSKAYKVPVSSPCRNRS